MNDFERLTLYYEKKWIDNIKLRQYVVFNIITERQYKEITGEDYI